MENARHTILVADSMKYERSAPARIGHMSMLDSFVTDAAPPEPLMQLCAEHGVAVEIAGPENEATLAEAS